jgi:DNA invertase Pin-like site-specific DNA recombinase
MRCVGYVRVSTDKQAERGVSLEAQAEKIRAMAVVHGAELVDIIVDAGESAKSLHRPGMARLKAMVNTGEVLPSCLSDFKSVACRSCPLLNRSTRVLPPVVWY